MRTENDHNSSPRSNMTTEVFILNLESDQQLLLPAQHGTEQVRIYYETWERSTTSSPCSAGTEQVRIYSEPWERSTTSSPCSAWNRASQDLLWNLRAINNFVSLLSMEPSKSGFILKLENDQQLLLSAQHGTEQVRIYSETWERSTTSSLCSAWNRASQDLFWTLRAIKFFSLLSMEPSNSGFILKLESDQQLLPAQHGTEQVRIYSETWERSNNFSLLSMKPSNSGFILKLESDPTTSPCSAWNRSNSEFILKLESDQQLLPAQHGTEQVRIYSETWEWSTTSPCSAWNRASQDLFWNLRAINIFSRIGSKLRFLPQRGFLCREG